MQPFQIGGVSSVCFCESDDSSGHGQTVGEVSPENISGDGEGDSKNDEEGNGRGKKRRAPSRSPSPEGKRPFLGPRSPVLPLEEDPTIPSAAEPAEPEETNSIEPAEAGPIGNPGGNTLNPVEPAEVEGNSEGNPPQGEAPTGSPDITGEEGEGVEDEFIPENEGADVLDLWENIFRGPLPRNVNIPADHIQSPPAPHKP